MTKAYIITAMLFLAGCSSEDNSVYATSRKYQELGFAYDRCLGDARYKSTFEQRLSCTIAVYGGKP
jgi:hypothetical protein